MTGLPDKLKLLLQPLLTAQHNADLAGMSEALGSLCAEDVLFRWCHPFGDHVGVGSFLSATYEPLLAAMPDLERRDWIVMAGRTEHGGEWVGCGGHYFGTLVAPFLDIPPSGHLATMRFHEFYRFEDGMIVEAQAIWDIPELMLQANAWPLSPSLGREMTIPGPMTQDGLRIRDRDGANGEAACDLIKDMLTAMKRHPREPVKAMELEQFWHPRMNWYGPAGIGTGRGIAGFRNWHQIPFLAAMPDRGQYLDQVTYHFFGEGDYVGVTGWPNMIQTITQPGWLGIAPSGQKIEMRSLDFWRLEQCEDGRKRIRENWVLVDLLSMYDQIGIDVFGRMREFNKARVPGGVPFPVGVA